jgi:hypothetical protein
MPGSKRNSAKSWWPHRFESTSPPGINSSRGSERPLCRAGIRPLNKKPRNHVRNCETCIDTTPQPDNFNSRIASPAPLRCESRISKYLQDRTTPGAPAWKAASTASFRLCGVLLLLPDSVGISTSMPDQIWVFVPATPQARVWSLGRHSRPKALCVEFPHSCVL